MLIPTPRFLALPLIALAVIVALGLQTPRTVVSSEQIVRAQSSQHMAATTNSLVR